MILRLAFLFFVVMYCQSCVTILNSESVLIDVVTSEPAEVYFYGDTLQTEDNLVVFEIYREDLPVEITFKKDSIIKEISLEPRNSPAFYLSTMTYAGTGFFPEWDSDKRYTFYKSIYVDLKDASSNFFFYNLPRKGELYFHTAIPYLSHFLVHPNGEEKYYSNTGYFGFSAGFDYYYKSNRFISFTGSLINGYERFWESEDLEPNESSMYSQQLSVAHNYRFNRMSIGFGLVYAQRTWHYSRWNSDPFVPGQFFGIVESLKYNVVGLQFPFYAQCSHNFYLGIKYQPTFFRANAIPKFKYEHILGAELAWKFRVKRGE